MSVDHGEAKSARAAARAHITDLDTEIESLQRLLEVRLLERDKWHAELNSYKYPVSTLPPEITSEIFTHFIRPYPERSTLSLAHYRVVYTTLWNAMTLTLSKPRLHEHQLPLLKMWLTHSGGCLLSIALLCGYNTRISTAAFVEAIVCHASRWQEIELQLPYEDLRHVTGTMPLLRTLTVGPNLEVEAPVAAPVVISTQAPNLKQITFSRCFSPFCITLPWSQITKLKLTGYLFDTEMVAILHQTAALEECSLALISVLSLPIPPIPPLVRLRSLILLNSSSDAEAYHILLPALTLPALEIIEALESFLGADPITTLSAFRPHGYPQRIKIFGARSTSDVITPHEMYAAAFPEATVYVDLEELDSDLDWLDSDSDQPNSGSDLSE
ncbi:hypothetical protein DFH07DRAFT_965082 [Mycena maculata]|uniref:F-box domain-containing protein n=1 Tax=Mycena maculata TaxID=230809 RepID=A0AAD7IEZ0_9AGAR|nr:hypothetical protein DFH07DRAFT_965082 [Mycena maculata]